MVQGLGFRVQVRGSRVEGRGSRAEGHRYYVLDPCPCLFQQIGPNLASIILQRHFSAKIVLRYHYGNSSDFFSVKFEGVRPGSRISVGWLKILGAMSPPTISVVSYPCEDPNCSNRQGHEPRSRGSRVEDSGFRVGDRGFNVQGLGFRVQGCRLRIDGVEGLRA